jgi:hypothetical protein
LAGAHYRLKVFAEPALRGTRRSASSTRECTSRRSCNPRELAFKLGIMLTWLVAAALVCLPVAKAEPPKKRPAAAARKQCLPKERWRSVNGEIVTDIVYTESQGIVLWCQDSSGKSCVEGEMERRGSFTMGDVHEMAARCCCAVID